MTASQSGALALGALLALAPTPVVPYATGDAAAMSAIDASCAERTDRALGGTPKRFVSIYGSAADGRWAPDSPELSARVARDPNIYSEVAQAWFADGSLATVAIAARSLDIAVDSSYCYRPGGTLARVIESSSGAQIRDNETRYLDEGGNVVGSGSLLSFLFPRPGRTLSPDLRPAKPALYLTVRDLPFYALLAGG